MEKKAFYSLFISNTLGLTFTAIKALGKIFKNVSENKKDKTVKKLLNKKFVYKLL